MKYQRIHQKNGDILNTEFIRGIAAFVPFYNEEGRNCTRIILNDGSTQTRETSAKATLNKILKLLGHDLKALQRHYGQHLNTTNPPLPLTYKLLFVPLKLRVPLARHDGAFGYVNYYQIHSLEAKKEVYLTLLSSKKLTIFQGFDSASKKINQGFLASILFSHKLRIDNIEEKVRQELLRKDDIIKKLNNSNDGTNDEGEKDEPYHFS